MMAKIVIPVRIVDLPFFKELTDDFTILIEAVVNKDIERSLEIAEGLAVKYAKDEDKLCSTCADYTKCNDEYAPFRLACDEHKEKHNGASFMFGIALIRGLGNSNKEEE